MEWSTEVCKERREAWRSAACSALEVFHLVLSSWQQATYLCQLKGKHWFISENIIEQHAKKKKKLQKYQHSDIFTCKSLISRRLSAGCTKGLSPGILVPSASRYQPTHLTFYHNCTSLMPVSLWGAGEGWHWKSPPSLPPSLTHRDSTMCTLADAEAHHSTLKPC